MISRTGIYALSAVIALAKRPKGSYCGTSDIAEGIGAPPVYLHRILKALAEEGLVVSQKGSGGGYRLAKNPEKISLFEVLEPLERDRRLAGWYTTGKARSRAQQNPIDLLWAKVRRQYVALLQETCIADVRD